MALPAGVTTATVTLKAPVAFNGTPGKVYLEIKPNVRIVHAASGTTLADWMTTSNADENGMISMPLPHTDQAGFLDESGAPIVNWSYTANIRYDLSGQVVSVLPKVFSLVSSISTMDLATLPVGAPIDWEVGAFGVVTSVNGETGAVVFDKSDIGLGNVNNTSDAQKPVSTAQQAALDLKVNTSTFVEQVQDIVSAEIVAGANITVTYNDTAGTITIASTGGGGTLDNEGVRDVIGAALVAGTGITVTVNDSGDTITIATTATATGLSVMNAASAAAARTAIGAVALGTTSTTAKAGDYAPSITDIPSGSNLVVQKVAGVWPSRPTSRTDIYVTWVGPTPNPSIVASPTLSGMYEGDIRIVTSA
jgi:hypothetical protein